MSLFTNIRRDIKVVFERDPAARTAVETLTTCPGLHAILLHRLNHYLWLKKCCLLARLTAHMARFLTGVEIHPGASIGRGFFIDHGMGIVIGETAEIGDNCSIYHGVTLGGTTWNKGKRHPTLEDDVIIGAGAKLLGPITIGQGARIGSNAVVVKNVPIGATVVGIPGHVVAERGESHDSPDKVADFNAYATNKDMPDPVAVEIGELMNQLEDMQDNIKRLEQELQQARKEILSGRRSAS